MQSNPKITVITSTGRTGGIDIWKASLQRQSYQNFEAILLDVLYDKRGSEVDSYLSDDPRLMNIEPLPKDPDDFWQLSKNLNHGLALATGELIVFYQDYIWLPEDALQRFVARHQEEPKALVSGVGHKGKSPNWAVNLDGAITIFTRSGFPGDIDKLDDSDAAIRRPEGAFFKDPRMKDQGFHPCNPIEYEGNWSMAPRSICEEIGGFDESFDAGWGYDNVNFSERALEAGYLSWLDESNICYGYSHELLFPEWWKAEPKNMHPQDNVNIWKEKLHLIQSGQAKYKVDDLNSIKKQLKLCVA